MGSAIYHFAADRSGRLGRLESGWRDGPEHLLQHLSFGVILWWKNWGLREGYAPILPEDGQVAFDPSPSFWDPRHLS